MASTREYPDRPIVGVGGVIIEKGRVVLIRRGTEPLKGEWSIPGGILKLGESLKAGVARELLEETGLQVQVLDLIEVFDRIYYDDAVPTTGSPRPPRFHYVIADYLCQRIEGGLKAGGDVTDVVIVPKDQLNKFNLTPTATRILKKAFQMERMRRSKDSHAH